MVSLWWIAPKLWRNVWLSWVRDCGFRLVGARAGMEDKADRRGRSGKTRKARGRLRGYFFNLRVTEKWIMEWVST
jgi:hypothetical protein